MKKIISRFTDSLISRDQMKKIKGSYGGNGCGTCDVIVNSGPFGPSSFCDSWPLPGQDPLEAPCACSTGGGCSYLA